MSALHQVRALVREYREVNALSAAAFWGELGYIAFAVASFAFGGWTFAVVTP